MTIATTLPIELLHIISSHLSQADIKSLRLVHRGWALWPCALLFTTLDASLNLGYTEERIDQRTVVRAATPRLTTNDESIRCLISIFSKFAGFASRPHIACHVREMSIGFGRMICGRHEYRWKQPGDQWDPTRLTMRYLHILGDALRYAVPRFARLRSIRLMGFHKPIIYGDSYCRLAGCFKWVQSPLDELVGLIFDLVSSSRNPDLREWHHTIPTLRGLATYANLDMLAGALAGLRTLTLGVDECINEPFDCYELTPNAPRSCRLVMAESLSAILRATRKLDQLSVYASDGHTHEDDAPNNVFYIGWSAVLSLPLRRLSLCSVCSCKQSCKQHICLLVTGEPSSVHTISELFLGPADMFSDCLIEILARHRTTLRTVELRYIRLLQGSWGRIFAYMIKEIPNLERVAFINLAYSRHGSSSHLHANERATACAREREIYELWRKLCSNSPQDYEQLMFLESTIDLRTHAVA